MALSNGLYEIRPYIAQGMCVDVAYNGANAGANVLIYGSNGQNNQKFYLEQVETDKWSIRCLSSGQYLDVYGGTAADGTNVVQWPDLDSANQRWKVTETGETAGPRGYPVVTIGTWADGTGTAYNMDIDHAMTSAMTNVLIWSANGHDNQKFVLFPTYATDQRLPMPTDFALSGAKFSEVRGTVMPHVGNLIYTSWTCVQSWMDSTDNSFEHKYDLRPIANDGSLGELRAGQGWYTDASAEHGEGLRYWASLVDPLYFTEYDGYKAVDVEYSVRTATERASAQGPSSVVGIGTSAMLRIVRAPGVTLDSAKFAPDGLHVAITSDYAGDHTNVLVTDLEAGGRHYVTELLPYEGLSNSDSFTIPMEVIGDWIAAGTELTISYRLGTEMMYDMGIEHTATLTSSYMEGGELSVTPTVTMDAGRLLKVETTEPLDTVWVVTEHGAYEAHMADGVAHVPYPFGVDFELIVCTRDGDQWGVLRYAAEQTAALVNDGKRPCHAWSWGDGFFVLEYRERGAVNTTRTVDLQADTYSLDTREWETLSFSPTARGTYKATGILADGVSECSTDDLLELAHAHHVTYRAPSGEIATVGITQVSYEASREHIDVTVSMTEETV